MDGGQHSLYLYFTIITILYSVCRGLDKRRRHQQSALDFTNPLFSGRSVAPVGLPTRQEVEINPGNEGDKMSHLVSVLHQVSQQVVHVQDAALGVLQVVGLHGGLAVLPHIHTNTVKERRATFV